MKKTFTLVKNLKATSMVAGLFFVASFSNAQVIRTDLNPDVTITQTTDDFTDYDVDLNNDGTFDFTIEIDKGTHADITGSFTGVTVGIFPYDDPTNGPVAGNAVAVDNTTDENAISFSAGNTIDASSTWSDEFGALLFTNGTFTPTGGSPTSVPLGNFLNSTGKFVGVKFIVGSAIHYGYIGINTSDNSFTVRDFAFESTPDAAISAGALSTSISSYVKSNTTIKNINNTIVAEFAKTFNGKMEIVNMNGQVVKSTTVNGISTSVSMEDAPTGIYQVVVSGADGFATEKVVVASK